jgi:hypothetical protein
MKARLIPGAIPGITRGHGHLGSGRLDPEIRGRASGGDGDRAKQDGRRRIDRHRPGQEGRYHQGNRFGTLLVGCVTLDEQDTLYPLVRGTGQVMNEVGGQGNQMDTQQPDDCPWTRTANSQPKEPKAGLEEWAPGDPE